MSKPLHTTIRLPAEFPYAACSYLCRWFLVYINYVDKPLLRCDCCVHTVHSWLHTTRHGESSSTKTCRALTESLFSVGYIASSILVLESDLVCLSGMSNRKRRLALQRSVDISRTHGCDYLHRSKPLKKGTAADGNRNEASCPGSAEISALSQKHSVEIQAFWLGAARLNQEPIHLPVHGYIQSEFLRREASSCPADFTNISYCSVSLPKDMLSFWTRWILDHHVPIPYVFNLPGPMNPQPM